MRAADSVLDHSRQAIEIEDVEVRVAALEQAAEQQKSYTPMLSTRTAPN
jgi:hypothetical protein